MESVSSYGSHSPEAPDMNARTARTAVATALVLGIAVGPAGPARGSPRSGGRRDDDPGGA